MSIILVAGTIYKQRRQIKVPINLFESEAIINSESPFHIDTDQDGLRDWEEVLWKTDSTNPDTDGDKTLDGDEIAKNRDPRITGPKDTLTDLQKPAYQQENVGTLTLSEQIRAEFYSQLALTEGQIDSSTLLNLFADVAEKHLLTETVNPYSKEDLKIVTRSQATYDNYANQISLLSQDFSGLFSQEFVEDVFASDILAPNDTAAKIADAKKLQDKLSKSLVPNDAIETHLLFINGLSLAHESLAELQEVQTDELERTLSIKTLSVGIQMMTKAGKNLETYIK